MRSPISFCSQLPTAVFVHCDLDGGVPELFLNVLEVKFPGCLHGAGHIMTQHVEGGLDAELSACLDVLRREHARADVFAVLLGKDKVGMFPGLGAQAAFGLFDAIGCQQS